MEDDWKEVHSRLLAEPRRYELAYPHVLDTPDLQVLAQLRPLWPGTRMALFGRLWTFAGGSTVQG